MRAITKGSEPASLTEHRLTPHCDYENYRDKDTLRQALVREQRGLCCYCMGPIREHAMKIEHWRCLSRHEAEGLHYRNLLGSCPGGEGQPSHLQHCDTRKGQQDLRWSPADPTHAIEARLRYEADGAIRSDDVEFDGQLERVLNLNLNVLKNRRGAVLDAVIECWKLTKNRLRGPVPRQRFERERDRRLAGHGDLEPYCQVGVWWLNQRLARMRA